MTGPYVSRSALAAKKRRQVRTVNPGLIGKRTTVPKRKPPARKPRKRTKYQGAAVLGSFGSMCTALFAATGSIFWAVGAITTAGAGVAVAHLEYRRDLAAVKRTGKPIEDPAPAARRTDDLSDRPEPQPVDLDPPQPRPAQPRRTRAKPGGDHLARCQAKPPGGPTCRCADGPNRGGAKKATTKRATTGARRKK